jgi:hypothetical protein
MLNHRLNNFHRLRGSNVFIHVKGDAGLKYFGTAALSDSWRFAGKASRPHDHHHHHHHRRANLRSQIYDHKAGQLHRTTDLILSQPSAALTEENHKQKAAISGSHGDKYKGDCVLGRCAVWSDIYWPTFQRYLLHQPSRPSSRWRYGSNEDSQLHKRKFLSRIRTLYFNGASDASVLGKVKSLRLRKLSNMILSRVMQTPSNTLLLTAYRTDYLIIIKTQLYYIYGLYYWQLNNANYIQHR